MKPLYDLDYGYGPEDIYPQPLPDDLEPWEIEQYLPYSHRRLCEKISLEELLRQQAFKEKYGKCWTFEREWDQLRWEEEVQSDLEWDLLHPPQPPDAPPIVGVPYIPEADWDAPGIGLPPTPRHPDRRRG
jgi:hypothetical protein